MDEMQGTEGVRWTWGAPESARGATLPRNPAADAGGRYVATPPAEGADPAAAAPPAATPGSAAEAEAEAARAEEEWFAAGLTVPRPTPPPEAVAPPVAHTPVGSPPAAAPPVDSPSVDPPSTPPDQVTRAEQERETAGVTAHRPIVPTEPALVAPPEDVRHEETPAIVDAGLAPTPQDERDDGYEGRHHAAEEQARARQAAEEQARERAAADASLAVVREPVVEMMSEGAPVASPDRVADAGPVPETVGKPVPGSATRSGLAEGWNGPQGGAQWQQQAQSAPGQWPGQEPWPHDGGQHPEPAEQTWHQQPVGSPATAAQAPRQPTGQVWDPRQQRWVEPEPETATASAAALAVQGVDPAYTWRGERGELYVWDGYQWVLQPEPATTNPRVPEQASVQPQASAEHTWDGPNGEYWVWDGYQWVQRERPAPVPAPAQPAPGQPQPAEPTSPEHTWDGPNGEYRVWDGHQWVQRERPTVQAPAVPVRTWTGDDGQVWEWDPANSAWQRQQGERR